MEEVKFETKSLESKSNNHGQRLIELLGELWAGYGKLGFA